MRRGRYVQNQFASGRAALELDAEATWRQVSVLLPELNACVSRGAVPDSKGKLSRDYTVYTGLAGVALAHLRVGLHCRNTRKDETMARWHVSTAHATAQACMQAESGSREVSFFCGTPGYLAISCVASHIIGDNAASAQCLTKLLEWVTAAVRHSEDELLFGRAGYIYALLWVRSYLGTAAADFEKPLRQTAERLVETGQALASNRRYSGWPLMWHCFDEPYLGAAHGHVGILAMLLHCSKLLQPGSRGLVEATSKKLLSIRFPTGNLPIMLGDSSDEHVHWCHGAAGLPALATVAAQQIGDGASLWREVAEKAGEVVWERGVILKGNGLCHGLAGNGYTFLSLYRLTGDAKHLQRAYAFAHHLIDPDVQQAIQQQPDPQRRVPGVPDSPQSLMEGSAGVICFLLDLSAPATSAFPAWELEVPV